MEVSKEILDEIRKDIKEIKEFIYKKPITVYLWSGLIALVISISICKII